MTWQLEPIASLDIAFGMLLVITAPVGETPTNKQLKRTVTAAPICECSDFQSPYLTRIGR